MDKERINQLYEFYKYYLFENVLPFWLKNSPDWEKGGYFTCLDREGKKYSSDKSVWFQGRGAWMFSKLYNTAGKRREWLDVAKLGYDFLTKHCFDGDERMFFAVTEDGRPLEKRNDIYSEAYAVMACAEYSKASGDKDALKKAAEIFETIMEIYNKTDRKAPGTDTGTRPVKPLDRPMILLDAAQVLREAEYNPKYDKIAAELVETVFRDFFKPDEKALFETVGLNGERLDSPQGRCISPGHCIEIGSFIMFEGLYRSDRNIMENALKILDWALELGWDSEFGGLLYNVDIEGKPPEQPEWDTKMWWPHTEALSYLLLAYDITRDEKYENWYEKVHEWAFQHFEDKVCGEWFGYLHRDGSISDTLKGSLTKGPFHLPRALLLNFKLLEKMKTI